MKCRQKSGTVSGGIAELQTEHCSSHVGNFLLVSLCCSACVAAQWGTISAQFSVSTHLYSILHIFFSSRCWTKLLSVCRAVPRLVEANRNKAQAWRGPKPSPSVALVHELGSFCRSAFLGQLCPNCLSEQQLSLSVHYFFLLVFCNWRLFEAAASSSFLSLYSSSRQTTFWTWLSHLELSRSFARADFFVKFCSASSTG